MIDLSTLKSLKIPQGTVTKIVSGGVTLWEFISNVFKNWVPYSLSSDGKTIYNTTGYKDGYRLSSSGSEKTQTDSVLTGFIPAKPGDVIRMKGVRWGSAQSSGYCYLAYYTSTGSTPVFTINKFKEDTANNNISNASNSSNIDYTTSGVFTDEKGVTTFQINFKTAINYSYIRINATGKGADMIVSINQEIPD